MSLWHRKNDKDTMTVTRLIGLLKSIESTHGDKEVFTLFDGCAYTDFNMIDVEDGGVYVGDGWRERR